MSEFTVGPPRVDCGGDPATDRTLTIRVHPDDDPHDPHARRVVRSDDASPTGLWLQLTGGEIGTGYRHADVVGWPRQHWLIAVHDTRNRSLDGQAVHQHHQPVVERGDMDVTAFRTPTEEA